MTSSMLETVTKFLAPFWVLGWAAFIWWTVRSQVLMDGRDYGESLPMFISRCAAYAGLGALGYATLSILIIGAFVLCVKLLLWSFTGSQYLPP